MEKLCAVLALWEIIVDSHQKGAVKWYFDVFVVVCLSKLKLHQRSDVTDVQNITSLRPLCPISFLFQIYKELLNKQSSDLRCSYDITAIRYMIIKLVPIITHSNMTWHNTTMTFVEHRFKFELTKDISYLTLMGKLWVDILRKTDDNIRRLCGTRLSCNTSSLWHDSLELFI